MNHENTIPVPPVSGYRQLTQAEVDLMNEGNAIFNAVGAYLDKLGTMNGAMDGRCISIAKTKAQTAAMWAMRAITKPGGFA